jgi:3-hydroxybutyryl-CoA dehydratase
LRERIETTAGGILSVPNPIRQKTIAGLREGDTFTLTRAFTREETEQFGDLTRDYNPVHYDRRWADAKGFPGLICHGLLVGSMICEAGGQIGWLASGMQFRFTKPVYFGDTITCRFTIESIEDNGRAEADAVFTNQDGLQVCRARLTGRVPLASERSVLSAMVAEGDPTNRLG